MKAKEVKISETPILYDASAIQTIPLEIQKGSRTFRVTHTLAPLPDERFFELEEALERASKNAKQISTKLFEPRLELWRELAKEISGYGKSEDWREKMYPADAVQAIIALLHTQIVFNTEDVLDAELVLEFGGLTEIKLNCLFSGALVGVTHFFREETKQEMDEFLAIKANAPNPNALASAKKLSQSERLATLGRKVLDSATGYQNDVVPAWHLVATTQTFFEGQLARLGKL